MTQTGDAASPWLRRIEMTLNGLDGRTDGQRYVSDGTQKHLRIDAQIEKTLARIPAACQVRIFNLGKESRDGLDRGTATLDISAGWENLEQTPVFTGNVLRAETVRSGPDLVTVLHAQTARKTLLNTPIFKTWRNVDVATVVRETALELEDVAIGNISGIAGRIGARGIALNGAASDVLNGLAKQYGFSWYVDAKKFYAIGDAHPGMDRNIRIEYPNLIAASPIVALSQQWRRGTKLVATFMPELQPGDRICVQAKVDGANNGCYYVNTLSHSLSCFEPNSFMTEIVAFDRFS